MYNLIIIGGKPGSGKTTLLKQFERLNIASLGIDEMYLKAPRDPNIQNWFEDQVFLDTAYTLFKEAILQAMHHNKPIAIETTGTGKRWADLFAELRVKFADQIITIYLETSQETSTKRVRDRNETDYPIKMTEERLDTFFKLAKDAPREYQQVIDADRPLDEVFDEILSLIKDT
jgi:thymidylate kinase